VSELKEKRNMNALKSVDEAAGLLGISPWTVRAWIREGRLRPVRLGRRVLLSEAELERLVTESQEPAEPTTSREAMQ
jgi:excisionase family DNA binding protein